MKFKSTKVFDGFSTCFRQWRAEDTACRFLHGYAVSFKVTFEGELDHRNWVWDFGGMKRSVNKIDGKAPNEYFKWLLDHTVLISQDDPALKEFVELHQNGVLQLRILPAVGCERFAEYLLNIINDFLTLETNGRVKATEVEVREHEKNTASAFL
jgi:6-pyruvoyltetrahydropterin/6-carboxytetrahydropterin synthase